MLKKTEQLQMNFSQSSSLYDILIQKDNFWRKLKESVDFGFVREDIQKNYSEDMGRPAESPELMLKFLLLKTQRKLSDRDLVDRVRYDMEMKYFLGYQPEDTEFINPSLLSKFRSLRLKDSSLLDLMIRKTVQIALEKGVISDHEAVIMDSTHSNAMYQHVSPREELIHRAKELRKSVYAADPAMHDRMPAKKESTGLLEDEMEYCRELSQLISKDQRFTNFAGIQERLHYLEEGIDDCDREIEFSRDHDAKVGHKTADTSFFGYKTHIAMTPERVITAAVITTGEKHDGKQLQELTRKTEEAGITISAIIGDGAYSEKDNIEYTAEKDIKLASKLSECVLHGVRKENGFEFNKDAGMYVCPAGHMAIRKAKQGSVRDSGGDDSRVETYYFDVEKCRHCPMKEGCYKEGSKTRTYSVKIKSDTHIAQMDYMETEEFQELYSHRYKIEAKNAEIKNIYDYGNAQASGITGMTLQGACTLFLTNLKRIDELEREKEANTTR